ncbi:MAG: substrate-binding domain-containing protein [Lentisphaerae bacterium]|nr:substrate-binding domain-containing protein [Lentisphaerota bacterium]
MRPIKYLEVAERLEARVRRGDYNLIEIPAERELAVETGVSYATARKAVQHLVENGVLSRLPNGRATPVAFTGSERQLQVAFLTPAWESEVYSRWSRALTNAAKANNTLIRRVLFVHWDDPAILASIQGFDGVFIVPEPVPPPETLIKTLRESDSKIVVIESDWSNLGFRSVVTNPEFCTHRLLEHLASLGHTKIDYFNVQPDYYRFLQPWRLWLEAQGFKGKAFDFPVKPYEDTTTAAYTVVNKRIATGEFKSEAILCATDTAACGAVSALLDNGLRPGYDISVCTADYGAKSALFNPSITSIGEVNVLPFATVCLNWMADSFKSAWPGPLLLQPGDVTVVERQTTVPKARNHRKLK